MELKDSIWYESDNDDVLNILMTSSQARKIKEMYLRTSDTLARKSIQQLLEILEVTIEGINLH